MNTITQKLMSVGKASARFGVLRTDFELAAEKAGVAPPLTLDTVSYFAVGDLKRIETVLREERRGGKP